MIQIRRIGAIVAIALALSPVAGAPTFSQEGRPDPRRRIESDDQRREDEGRRDERFRNAAEEAGRWSDIAKRGDSEFHDLDALSKRVDAERNGADADARRKTEATLKRIENGEVDPHRNDGAIFKNREGLLPKRDEGYYKEYVYREPGSASPGEERVIVGRDGDVYFTRDHYDSFEKIK
jgi:guanyl-specific ribonuclease Sa